MNIILDIRSNEFAKAHEHGPAYARVLGFRRESKHLLALIEANSKVPLVTNIKHANRLEPYERHMLEAELRATDIYGLSADRRGKTLCDRQTEYNTPIIYG